MYLPVYVPVRCVYVRVCCAGCKDTLSVSDDILQLTS